MRKRASKSPIQKQLHRFDKHEQKDEPRWEHEYGVWRRIYKTKKYRTFKWDHIFGGVVYRSIDNKKSKWTYELVEEPSYKDKPKRKRTAPEYHHYCNEPKWWRKMFHVRKFRAANKRYMYKMRVNIHEWEYSFTGEDIYIKVHPYDDAPEPLWNKPHLYYY